MNKSFHIKNSIRKLFIIALSLLTLTGCSFAPIYTDSETGELAATPARISLLKKSSVKTIYSSDTNVFFLMNNAAVLASGCNDKGLLGQGNTDEYSYVVQVKLPERIKNVAANASMAVAVSDTNNVYIWGDLAWWDSESLTVTEENFTYKKFSFNEIITDVSISSNHIALLTKNGFVYTLGYNYGQLGYDFDSENRGSLYSEFEKLEIDIFVSQIETNETATYMLSNNGQLYGCSLNEYCELGYIDSLNAINRIESNVSFSAFTTAGQNLLALSSDGDVYVCGQNTRGVLGLNSSLSVAAALTKIPFENNMKIKSLAGYDSGNAVFFTTEENKVYACGANSENALYTENTNDDVLAPSLVNIGDVSAFYGMGAAKFYLNLSQHLYTYGDNSYGQMPIDDADNKDTFVEPVRIYANVK